MASGDVYLLTDIQTIGGSEVLNVYTYQQQAVLVATDVLSKILADNWVDQILPKIAYEQLSGLTHVGVSVKNLFDPSDFYDAVISVPGAGDDSLASRDPNFTAVGIKFDRDTLAVRTGAKRIAGLNTAASTDGVITSSGDIAGLLDMCDYLSGPVYAGLPIPDPIWFPVVVKRVREGISGSYTYRLPETSGELIYANVTNAVFNFLLTSQVSRKIGVGV